MSIFSWFPPIDIQWSMLLPIWSLVILSTCGPQKCHARIEETEIQFEEGETLPKTIFSEETLIAFDTFDCTGKVDG